MKLPRKANLLYTFQTGYSFVSLPLSLLSFATTIYYLLVNNVKFLKTIFPEFWMFLVVGGLVGFPTVIIIGQLFIKSELNKASTRTHPFSRILVPTQVTEFRFLAKLARREGFIEDADALDRLIEESVKNW